MLLDPNGRSLGIELIQKAPSLQVKLLDPNAKVPVKAHAGDLGYDLFALEDMEVLPSSDFAWTDKNIFDGYGDMQYDITTEFYTKFNLPTKVRTGIACGFPFGYGALIRDRSSVATKQGLIVVAGVIDSEYSAEILVAFANLTNSIIKINAGDKIAQMILLPVVSFPVSVVDSIEHKGRGERGFGSSGG